MKESIVNSGNENFKDCEDKKQPKTESTVSLAPEAEIYVAILVQEYQDRPTASLK